jgi:hypothetical protein
MNTKKQRSLAHYKNSVLIVPVWNVAAKAGGGMMDNHLIACFKLR